PTKAVSTPVLQPATLASSQTASVVKGPEPKPKLFNIEGVKRPGEFLPREHEDKSTFTSRMAGEMSRFRAAMDARAPKPEGEIPRPTPTLRAPYQPTPERLRIDSQMRGRKLPVPVVGISNRPGFGYDESVFAKGSSATITPTSLPANFKGLPQEAT